MKKLFLPPGSKVVGSQVTLASGDVVPKWVLIGVPARQTIPLTKQSGVGLEPSGVYVDVVTGAVTTNPPPVTGYTGSRSGSYDFSTFTRYVPREKFVKLVGDSIPKKPTLPDVSNDPGYFVQIDASARETFPIDEKVPSPIVDTIPIGSGYTVRSALIWEGRPQELAPQDSTSEEEIILNMRRVVVNVLNRLDADNAYKEGYSINLAWRIRSWFVDSNYWTPDPESHVGSTVRIEFTGAKDEVYRKAVDLATKLSFERMYLDYRSDGRTLITIVAPEGRTARRIGTRYDDILVSDNRFICASGGSDITEDPPLATRETDAEVQPALNDNYYSLYIALKRNPDVYGGITAVQEILRQLGFPSNPLLSGIAGFTESAGSAASVGKELMSKLTGLIQCPPVSSNPKLFPTSSHPAFRGLSDHTQLDDTDTQDTIPHTVRTNNPLKVKTVKGVTDLKDRFGYLGDANGVAVFRDHIGGAAAGLAYLMTMGGGTVAGAAKAVLGAVGSSDDGSDITTVTMSKVMQGLGQALFGIPDPTGAVQECATITDDLESLVTTAASMAASLLGIQTSPLTKNEWDSAYQIAKNQAGSGVTKSSTGLSLPVTERQDNSVQATGSRTEKQGKDAPSTVDEEKAKNEKWNPIANFEHYAENVWKTWVQSGIIKYEQKSGADDKDKIGKKTDKEKLEQNPKTYTTTTVIESLPGGSRSE